ncbi:superoxide dismutase, partial [Candidatus Peregrinibacteria bacterium RIFOXYA2_FULL_33_7]
RKYYDTFIDLIKGTDLESERIEDVLAYPNEIPENIRQKVINNGGGYFNHNIFWEIMGPNAGGEPEGKLMQSINENFGSFEDFKMKFNEVATTHFGSGWAWLVLNSDDKLQIMPTLNQDNPISKSNFPLMGIDLWEHAYYLKYQNKRPEYIENWWNVVNWENVLSRYNQI